MEDKSSSNASPSPLDATRHSSNETPAPSAAFTPGPWITETIARFVWIGPAKAAGPKVADVVTCIACDGLSAQAEAKVFANARLIAAAPDLLTTSKAWIDYLDAADWLAENAHITESRLLAAMRAAIAKAEGRQP